MKLRKPTVHLVILLIGVCTLIRITVAAPGWTVGFAAADGVLTFSFETEAGPLYRIEASDDLDRWQAVRTVEGDGSVVDYSEQVDPDRGQRFFRAVQAPAGTELTGDFLATEAGGVLIHPVNHASLVLQWNGLTIYNDPVGGAAAFVGIPPADLILVGHRHGDHLSASTIEAIRKEDARIIAPQDVYNTMSATLKELTTILDNGESAALLGLAVEAVPAYNANHPEGRDNGYIVTIGARRVYFSGDTADIAEMRALTDIDVAFVCMNVPFTMSIEQAASAVREFKPKAIYPYHYRNQDGSFADLARFRELVGTELGVEVRLRVRDWY